MLHNAVPCERLGLTLTQMKYHQLQSTWPVTNYCAAGSTSTRHLQGANSYETNAFWNGNLPHLCASKENRESTGSQRNDAHTYCKSNRWGEPTMDFTIEPLTFHFRNTDVQHGFVVLSIKRLIFSLNSWKKTKPSSSVTQYSVMH